MVGCLTVASGMAVQWRAYQSVDANVAGQPKARLPVLDLPALRGPWIHSLFFAMLGLVVMRCQGRAPGVRC